MGDFSIIGQLHIMLCLSLDQQQIQLAGGRLLVSGQHMIVESKDSHN